MIKDIIPIEVFFIKIGKSNSVVKSSKGKINFTFVDSDCEILKNGAIADFKNFETQLKNQLEKIGFRGLFKKKIGVLALPPNSSYIEKRAFFDSLESIGFRENYLIGEHFAFTKGLEENLSFSKKIYGIIDFGESKVNQSLIEGVNSIKSTSFHLSKARLDKYLKIPSFKNFIIQSIIFDSKDFFADYKNNKNFQLVLTGGRLNQITIAKELNRVFSLKSRIIKVKNNDDFIIRGLEIAWDNIERI